MTLTRTLLAQHLLGLLDPDTAESVETQLATEPDAQAMLDALRAETEAPVQRRGPKPSQATRLARAIACPAGHAPENEPCSRTGDGHPWLCAQRLAVVGIRRPSGTSGSERPGALVPGCEVTVQTDLLAVRGRLVERSGPRRWRVRVGDEVIDVASKRLRCVH